jgi:hypothetical protein
MSQKVTIDQPKNRAEDVVGALFRVAGTATPWERDVRRSQETQLIPRRR